jgi:AAA domain
LIEDSESYVTYLASDWEEAAAGQPDFIVDQVASSAVTLVYGRSEAGKSMTVQALLAALVSGETQFLGREVQRALWNAGVLTGDYGDGVRYSRRLTRVLGPDGMSRIRVFDASGSMPFFGWDGLLTRMIREGRKILVVDNLSAFVPGDINSGPACQTFFNALSPFTKAGIAVIVVAHSSEKYVKGGNTEDFIGHSSIKQRATHHCKVTKKADGTKTLWFHGNDGAEHEITVRQADFETPLFEVLRSADAAALADKRAKRAADRQEQQQGNQQSKKGQIRECVLAECQGLNRNQTADKLAARFGGSAQTYQGQLSRGYYGVKLGEDRRWVPVLLAA